jgi:hypothetical protein
MRALCTIRLLPTVPFSLFDLEHGELNVRKSSGLHHASAAVADQPPGLTGIARCDTLYPVDFRIGQRHLWFE